MISYQNEYEEYNGEGYKCDDDTVKSGNGVCKYYSGDIYTGLFKNNLKNGEGKMHYTTNDIIIGRWENDKLNGPGIMVANKGYIYSG